MDSSAIKLSMSELLELAKNVAHEYFAGEVEPVTLACVAYIESGGNPNAVQCDQELNTTSIGLCQTNLMTARWLVTDTTPKLPPHKLKCRPVGAPVPKPKEIADPSQLSLMDPFTAMWYGAAYLQHLSVYGYEPHSEEWIVRAYKAGPTGVQWKNTDWYWNKYCLAKNVVMAALAERMKGDGGGLLQVQSGDTMWSIAKSCGIDFGMLVAYNPQIMDANDIEAGDILVIPAASVPPSLPPSSFKNRMSPPCSKPSSVGLKSVSKTPPVALVLEENEAVASQLLESPPRRRAPSKSRRHVNRTKKPNPWFKRLLRISGRSSLSTRLCRIPIATAAAVLIFGFVIVRGISGPKQTRQAKPSNLKSQAAAPKENMSGFKAPVLVHTLLEGQTLYAVAKEYSLRISSLLEANPDLKHDPNKIEAGAQIRIPNT